MLNNTIEQQQIHIWQTELNLPKDKIDPLKNHLSSEELTRVKQFTNPELQSRYIQIRAYLRLLLQRYLDIATTDIEFQQETYGKPILHSKHAGSALHFNLSHTENILLYAFRLHAPVGIDIENHNRSHPIEIAKRFFTAEEYDTIQALPVSKRQHAFIDIWVKKEALVKATGHGFLRQAKDFSVTPHQNKQRIMLANTDNNQKPWTIHSLDISPQYYAALATPSEQRGQVPTINLMCIIDTLS